MALLKGTAVDRGQDDQYAWAKTAPEIESGKLGKTTSDDEWGKIRKETIAVYFNKTPHCH